MSPDAIEVLRLVLELLFFDYGRPQHRLLLSAVKRLPPRCLDTVGHILTSRIQGEIEGFRTQGGWEGGKADSIVLGQTLSSLLWLPAFNDWIRYESRGGIIIIMIGYIIVDSQQFPSHSLYVFSLQALQHGCCSSHVRVRGCGPPLRRQREPCGPSAHAGERESSGIVV